MRDAGQDSDNPARKLAAYLAANGIGYCHWKSNEHLEAGLEGETDLDILFCRRDRDVVDTLLMELGFRRFESVWYSTYPDVRDYLALNPSNGNLIHIHAHFQLVLGESGVKNFVLPWGDDYVARAVTDPESGFAVAAPAEEMLLLMIREAIKKRFPTPLRVGGGRRSPADRLPDDLREFAWLKQRVARRDMEDVARTRLGPGSAESILSLYDAGLSADGLLRFYRANEETIRAFRRCGTVTAFARRWARRMARLTGRAVSRSGLLTIPLRHTAVGAGVIVAIMGPDGAGKSTLLRGMMQRLDRKIDVVTLYLGSGQGKSSLLRAPLVVLRRLFGRKPGGAADVRPRSESRKESPLRAAFDLLWAVTLAQEKKQKLRAAERARRRGMFVLTDRYPQISVARYNDGPLLTRYLESPWRILRSIARWERRCYDPEHVPRPDIVLKLTADPALLMQRRPEMDPEIVRLKQESILKVAFPGPTRVIHLDAHLSRTDLLNAALSAVMDRPARPHGATL